MSFGIFIAVLFAALLHASWNAIVKLGDDKIKGMFIMSSAQGLLGVGLIFTMPLPQGETWLWLAASTVLHSAYKTFLTLAYERGDLSRVYPIARGTAPMIVAIVSVLVLSDTVETQEYVGILLVGLGILTMARGVFTNGETRSLLPFALASAVATAGYSLTDGIGARGAGNATLYVAWAFALDGVLFGMWALYHRGASVITHTGRTWALGVIAGAASFGAYWIVVYAMTLAPIALVTALRETSVLFAVMIGILFFRERADRAKLFAAVLIVAGVVLTRF